MLEYAKTKHCRKVKDGNKYVCQNCFTEIEAGQHYPWCLFCTMTVTEAAYKLFETHKDISEVARKLKTSNTLVRYLMDYRQPSTPYFRVEKDLKNYAAPKVEPAKQPKSYSEILVAKNSRPLTALEKARLRIKA